MRIRAGLTAAALFALLVVVAAFVRDEVIRPHGGDVLVVMFIHFAMRAVTGWSRAAAGITAFVIAGAVELGQVLALDERLGVSGTLFGDLVLGSTGDWRDIVAYGVGAAAAFLLDRTTGL